MQAGSGAVAQYLYILCKRVSKFASSELNIYSLCKQVANIERFTPL